MDGAAVGSCPLLRQLLADPRMSGDVHDRRAFLKEVVQIARASPPGTTFSSLSRQLAELSFCVGDEEDGIFNLTESHAVLLRHKMIMMYHRSLRKNPQKFDVIHKKYIDFEGEYTEGFCSVVRRLKEMPKEWTVIQLSCAPDAVWRFGGPNAKQWTPKLHLVRMECGPQPDFKPLHLVLPPGAECADFVVLEKLREMLAKNITDRLTGDRSAFWEARTQVDKALQDIIDFINSKWLARVSPFFAGRLADDKLRKKIRRSTLDAMLKVMLSCEKYALPDETVCLLVKAVENVNTLSEDVLRDVIATAMKGDPQSPLVRNILKEFKALKKEYCDVLNNTRKHPVILILDEKLEPLPFESLQTLKDHPVTRVPSLHFIHGLHSVHSSSIENGLKVLNAEVGFYLINPGKDLNAMEERMSNFLVPRVPSWKGVVGDRLPEDNFCELLKEKELFVYMGHGNGSQYCSVDYITSGIKSTVILFGCKSAGYKTMLSCLEVDSSLHSYLTAACPCIVGMLWEVTDRDTDLLAQGILDLCLPRYNEEIVSVEDNGKRKKDKQKKTSSSDSKKTSISPPIEPEVARAIVMARNKPKMLLTRTAVVMRGIPVCIK